MKAFQTLGAVIVVAASALAQQAPAAKPSASPAPPTAKSASTAAATKWPAYCSKEAGFCLDYPPSWKRLGEVFEGTGLVVALPKQDVAEEAWAQVTASAVAMPEEPEGKEPPSFEDVVNVVLESLEPGAQKRTLSRTSLLVDSFAAQRAKVQYIDQQGKPWVEDVVFIDGDDVIFSLALRCAPEEQASLEPVFERMIKSWRIAEQPEKAIAKPASPAAPATKPQ